MNNKKDINKKIMDAEMALEKIKNQEMKLKEIKESLNRKIVERKKVYI